MSEKSNRSVQYCCNNFLDCSNNAISTQSLLSRIFPLMLSVTIASLKILTATSCNCLSYEKVLIIARGNKKLSTSQKAMIVKLCERWKSYRNISSNLNIPFTTISSFIARFKRLNVVENKKRTGVPRRISPRLSRKLGRLINRNQMVTCEELQEDLHFIRM